MKFGIREICDVVLRAKAAQKIGNKVFYKNEPVLYFDSLKTSSMEGAATTVYAQGGRGNSRLIAWEGERTVTFTMEDALISPMGFSVLTGSGLIEAEEKPIITHRTEQVKVSKINKDSNNEKEITSVEIKLSERPYTGQKTEIKYRLAVSSDPVESLYKKKEYKERTGVNASNFNSLKPSLYILDSENEEYTLLNSNAQYDAAKTYYIKETYYELVPESSLPSTIPANNSIYYIKDHEELAHSVNNDEDFIYVMLLNDNGEVITEPYIASEADIVPSDNKYTIKIFNTDNNTSNDSTRYNDLSKFTSSSIVLVDYYVEHTSSAFQIDITPDKFGGNFYLEASTLFRTTQGVDMPAEFVIPNCKIQSNFTFTMASSGDPSTFTFTMDAFPDYTRWDRTKKVFAAIQVIDTGDTNVELERLGTDHNYGDNKTEYDQYHKPFIEFD